MISSGYEEVGIRFGHATASNQKVWEETTLIALLSLLYLYVEIPTTKVEIQNSNQLSWAINKEETHVWKASAV